MLSDMWSLGCVFAEMFISLTPLFQSVDNYERVLKYFEVIYTHNQKIII